MCTKHKCTLVNIINHAQIKHNKKFKIHRGNKNVKTLVAAHDELLQKGTLET